MTLSATVPETTLQFSPLRDRESVMVRSVAGGIHRGFRVLIVLEELESVAPGSSARGASALTGPFASARSPASTSTRHPRVPIHGVELEESRLPEIRMTRLKRASSRDLEQELLKPTEFAQLGS